MNNLIIGIAGGSGSGKTTLACRLKALFGEDEVRLISHDSYYKRHDELPFEERCKLNYDHPDAFDNALLIYHLQELKAGRAIDCPVYDYADHNRSNEVQHIEPAPVLIVEGILPFVEPELCAMFDYKIFVDESGKTAAELCSYIDAGMPVVFWATLDFQPVPEKRDHWLLADGTDFAWKCNEHCLLLVGYDDENYWFNDPWHDHGVCPQPKQLVEDCHAAQGLFAVTLRPKGEA